VRRTEKAIDDRAAIDAVVRACRVCRLGMVDGAEPYIVPLCFGYDGEALYFHCAPEGRKLEILRRHPRVCFEFDEVEGLLPADEACRWGIRYRSVMGTGTAEFLEDPAAKRRAFERIMAQYTPGTFTFPDGAVARTTVLRVRIESLSGKQSAR